MGTRGISRLDSKLTSQGLDIVGAYDFVPQLNTTIHVVDVTKLGSTSESAIVHSIKLQGAHHGVAIPVDDGHVLHSLALDDRVNRVPNTTSLPTTFK